MIPYDPTPEDISRARKVEKLADAAYVLYNRDAHAAAVAAPFAFDVIWEALAEIADVKPPSEKTKIEVFNRLAERAEIERRAEPFARAMSGRIG